MGVHGLSCAFPFFFFLSLFHEANKSAEKLYAVPMIPPFLGIPMAESGPTSFSFSFPFFSPRMECFGEADDVPSFSPSLTKPWGGLFVFPPLPLFPLAFAY